jgi:hypothetical protein
MAPWENAQSSSLPERKNSYILLRKIFGIRSISDTGGRRRNVDLQVAVLCVTFLKSLVPVGAGCFVSSPYILWGPSCVTSVIRKLRFVDSWFLNTSQKLRSPFINKIKNKRQCNCAELLPLVGFIRACLLLSSNLIGTVISFLRKARVYVERSRIADTRLSVDTLSETTLFMLHPYSTVLKRLHFSSTACVNNLPLWFMCFSQDISKIIQHSVSNAANKCLINYFAAQSTRKKLQRNKVRNLWVDLIWLSLIGDSGSSKWRLYGSLWNYAGTIHACSCAANKVMFLADSFSAIARRTKDVDPPTQRNRSRVYCSFCLPVTRSYYGKEAINEAVWVRSVPPEVMGTESEGLLPRVHRLLVQ